MTKRQRFVEMISYGPGRLPLGYVIECFDLVEKEFAPAGTISTVLPSDVHTPVMDVPIAPGPAPVPPSPGAIMGDTMRGVEVRTAMVEERDQENADALAKIRSQQKPVKK